MLTPDELHQQTSDLAYQFYLERTKQRDVYNAVLHFQSRGMYFTTNENMKIQMDYFRKTRESKEFFVAQNEAASRLGKSGEECWRSAEFYKLVPKIVDEIRKAKEMEDWLSAESITRKKIRPSSSAAWIICCKLLSYNYLLAPV